jgi:uncharacterized MnhB-related membrane protein
MMDVLAFYAFAAIAVIASLLVIGQGNPMHSVMLLIVSFGALAGLYVLLDAPFTAVTQIIVYAGAIMVLFLFVVMLLNVPREEPAAPGGSAIWGPIGAYFLAEQGKVTQAAEGLGFSGLARSYGVGVTIRAGGFPLVNLTFAWGSEGHHIISTIDSTLLGGSGRPSLY